MGVGCRIRGEGEGGCRMRGEGEGGGVVETVCTATNLVDLAWLHVRALKTKRVVLNAR